MTEQSSPLEAAAKAACEEEAKGHRGSDAKWAWDDPIGRNQRHERWLGIARAAIAAYEAVQTTPDLDELTAALRAHFHGTERAPYTMRGHDEDAESCGHCGEAAEVALAHLKGETR